MIGILDSNALADEKVMSRLKIITMDRRFLVITAAVFSFASGFALKQALSHYDIIRPLTIVEHPPISPHHEILLGGDELFLNKASQ
jgi:hypothetical protein